ncbi:hypothetical protein BN903_338 [Halorubrum sp. AJ67]|nr:hypothetical protein BN903_338 [Halorubrum sp. AJ67]
MINRYRISRRDSQTDPRPRVYKVREGEWKIGAYLAIDGRLVLPHRAERPSLRIHWLCRNPQQLIVSRLQSLNTGNSRIAQYTLLTAFSQPLCRL